MQRYILQCLFIFGTCILLNACGFHLRGAVNLPFKSIYLEFAGNSTLGADLKRYIRRDGVAVVDDPQQAEVILKVLADTRDKKILTLNTDGRVREYALYQYFKFQVQDKAGKIVLTPTEITLKRSINYDANLELAKQAEEAKLYQNMQTDLAQQILRRLAAMRPDDGSISEQSIEP